MIKNSFKTKLKVLTLTALLGAAITAPAYAATDVTPPTVPTALKSINVGANSATLTWTASKDNVAVKGYDIYRNNVKLTSTPVTTTTYTDKKLFPTEVYNYSVVAIDTSNNQSLNSVLLKVTGATATALNNTNLCLNKTATANVTTTDYPEETPDKAVNGSITGGWSDKWCTGYNYGNNSWLKVDLGKNYYVNQWKIVNEKGRPDGDQRMFTKSFKLQASNDGVNWIDVDSVTNNTLGVVERKVPEFSARYVRLYIVEADFDTAARIYEFQVFRNVVDLNNTNLCLNKPATASVYAPADYSDETPDKAVNGSILGGWSDKWCSGYNYGNNSWLKVDLGNYYHINQWKIVNEKGRPGGDQRMFTKSFKLQASEDGVTWKDVDSVTNNTLGVVERKTVEFSARYLRLYIVEADFDTAARIYEFQASRTNVLTLKNTNLCLNKPASASVKSPVGFPDETPDKAVNGSILGGWSDKWCSGYNKGNNSWLKVDLGNYYYVNQWKIVNEKGRPGGDQRMFTKNFKLQASGDGQNWKNIDVVTNNTLGVVDRKVTEFGARYLRLYIDVADFDTAARIYEFQAFKK